MSKIIELSTIKMDLLTHQSRLSSLKCKDMKSFQLKLPVEIIDYLNELKKTRGFSKTKFCIERFIDGFKINSLLTKPSKRSRICLHMPEELMDLVKSDEPFCQSQLIRNAIILGFEKYQNIVVHSETTTKKQVLNQEIAHKKESQTYRVEMTISKMSEYSEWVWDNDYDGHYQPIISPRIEKTSYKMTLTQLNRFFENVVKKPLVITKFKITPN